MSNRAISIQLRSIVEHRSDAYRLLINSGDFIIVKRGIPRVIVLRCPCGCGDDLSINLDSRAGHAWKLYIKQDKYTLYPSYWRDTACGSHFIVWDNHIYWLNREDDDFDYYWEVGEEVENAVFNCLSEKDFCHYMEIADNCGLVPWECLQACMQLARKGQCLVRSKGGYRYFKKK